MEFAVCCVVLLTWRSHTHIQVGQWLERTKQFRVLCTAVSNMYVRLTTIPNRLILYDLYHYVWDAKEMTSLLNSYLSWLGMCIHTCNTHHTHIHTHIYTRAHTTHTHMHTRTHAHTHAHTQIYTHTHTHARMHRAHTHTHTHTLSELVVMWNASSEAGGSEVSPEREPYVRQGGIVADMQVRMQSNKDAIYGVDFNLNTCCHLQ